MFSFYSGAAAGSRDGVSPVGARDSSWDAGLVAVIVFSSLCVFFLALFYI